MRIKLINKLTAYCQLMRINKPIGTLLLLWPTLWALFLASNGMPDLSILFIFVMGVFLMRAAGCVINDYADRNVDGHVKRTASRPLVTGIISEKEAKILFVSLILLAFFLVLLLNRYVLFLSFVAVLLCFVYPFMKRYTYLPQFVLGMAFSFSIPMAYAAINQSLPLECWLLYIANMAWTAAYDTQYAMVDRDDDVRIGVKSTAILFAKQDNKIILLLQAMTLFILVIIGNMLALHNSYYTFLFIASCFFVYQATLTKNRMREACFKAFLNNNYFGMTVFIAILAGLFL